MTDPIAPGALYATGEQLAVRYGGRSEKWIRKHAIALGVTPLSEGPNSKLTYHLPTADAWMASRQRQPALRSERRRARPPTSTRERLPFV